MEVYGTDKQQNNQTHVNFEPYITENSTNITSSEIASIWNTIMHYQMIGLVMDYFAAKVQDTSVKEILSESRVIAQNRASTASQFFTDAQIPLPVGFSGRDVNVEAPSLYTDNFYLRYLYNQCRIGLNINVLNLAMSVRKDITDFYSQCVTETNNLNARVHNLMFERGLHIKSPYVNVQSEPEIIRNPSFLTGFIGKKRPLTTFEISHLFFNSAVNYFGSVLLTGFAQVTKTSEVRKYFETGAKMASGFATDFASKLREENLPITLAWDIGTTSCTEPPFSEKLMMFHVLTLNATGIGNYGVSASTSLRHDITAMYAKTVAEVATYSGEGARIMMDKGWLDEPPKKTLPETTDLH